MNWSLDAYNLIVYSDHDAAIFKNQSGTHSFCADRLFEYTGVDLKEKYQADWAGLSELPTLVLGEVSKRGTPAVFGRIFDIVKRDVEIRFKFERFIDQLKAEEVFSCGYFDVTIRTSGVDERSRTHWAVKQGNVIVRDFQTIKRPFG